MNKIKFLTIPLLLSFIIVFSSATRIDGDKQTERIHSAANVLKEFGATAESIPHALISQCEGIIVIPKMINAGLGIGGMRGKGIAVVKLDNGKWSDPVFVTITGGSIGAQIGVQSVDLVLVFHHKGVLAKVKNGDVTIGGDLSATAGPVSKTKAASTDYKMEAEIYSYTHSRGLFAGVTVNGSSLSIDKDSNSAYYGEGMSSQDIFASFKSNTPAVKTLKNALAGL